MPSLVLHGLLSYTYCESKNIECRSQEQFSLCPFSVCVYMQRNLGEAWEWQNQTISIQKIKISALLRASATLFWIIKS